MQPAAASVHSADPPRPSAPQPSLGDKPLSGDAIVRGAYVNAGSRDVGPDPNAAKYASRPA
jgi:hypothetical protein